MASPLFGLRCGGCATAVYAPLGMFYALQKKQIRFLFPSKEVVKQS
jgi:hypothetical protein